MNISSMLAVIILLTFIKIIKLRKDTLFDEYYIGSFFIVYTFVFMAFTGLFFYSLFQTIPQIGTLCSIIGGIVAGLGVGALIHLPPITTEEDNPAMAKTPLEWLWYKTPNSHGQIISQLLIVLSGPFVGIFTIQSEAEFGVLWFYGLIIGAVILEILSEIREFSWGDDGSF